MASITIRNLSADTKERLRKRAQSGGCSLEALVRTILDQAAHAVVPQSRFPHDLIALVEPGQDIEPFLRDHDQTQEPIDL